MVQNLQDLFRYALHPGTLDASDNLVDNPLTKEPDGTLTLQMKSKQCECCLDNNSERCWKAKLIADKTST